MEQVIIPATRFIISYSSGSSGHLFSKYFFKYSKAGLSFISGIIIEPSSLLDKQSFVYCLNFAVISSILLQRSAKIAIKELFTIFLIAGLSQESSISSCNSLSTSSPSPAKNAFDISPHRFHEKNCEAFLIQSCVLTRKIWRAFGRVQEV